MPQLQSLRTSPEFLRLKKTRPVRVPAFIVQGAVRPHCHPERSEGSPAIRARLQGDPSTTPWVKPEGQDNTSPRIGFIITKKIGNAVVRNRIRRRLKAALNFIANSDTQLMHTGWDYVVIPSIIVMTMPYDELVKTLQNALTRLKH